MKSPIALVQFLQELEQNNHRDWFEANRTRYQALRQEWTELTQQVILALAGSDPALEGLPAERTLFRINRDVRFSRDKSPYKTNFSALLNPGGKDMLSPGYYMQVDHRSLLMTGGGMWMPEAAVAQQIRSYIALHTEELRQVLSEPNFAAAYPDGLNGERLKRAPKGFEEDHPAIDLLKLKSFTIGDEVPITAAMSGGDLFEAMVARLAAAAGLVNYLRAAVGKREG
ncbi:MAG: DUF2461 domain-containing protein [Caldilineaceae bacterium]